MDSPLQMGSLISHCVGFLIALLGCSIFSFLETSITALRPFKLKEIASATNYYKRLLSALSHNPHQVLVTMLIANSFVNVTAAALSTTIMDKIAVMAHMSSKIGFSLGIGLGACAILVFGEVIPKSIAKVHGDALFSSMLWIVNAVFWLLSPVVTILVKISDFFISLIGGAPASTASSMLEPEIKFLIEHSNQVGAMEKDKSEMLQSIFKLAHKPVREIMIPSTDVIMVDSESSLASALDVFSKYQFSRVPVYQKDTDNIIGMIYQKDVFTFFSTPIKPPTIRELVRPILFVPESMKVNQLLHQFRDQRMHIAMVTNEFGSITGLVTLEDVLEEIVGEITDEYEPATRKIVPISDHEWLIDASLDLDTLEQLLHIKFNVENAVTLGGFLTEQLHHLPAAGQRISYQEYLFVVQQATHKRVVQVLVKKEPKNEANKGIL